MGALPFDLVRSPLTEHELGGGRASGRCGVGTGSKSRLPTRGRRAQDSFPLAHFGTRGLVGVACVWHTSVGER